MLLRFLLSSLFVLWAVSAPAAATLLKLDSLKVGSKVYRNVTVLGSSATDIYLTHSEGIANIKLKYLDAELQKKFKYDPKIAVDAEKQQARGDTLYHALAVSNLVAQAAKTARAQQLAASTSEQSLADPVSEKSLLGKQAPTLEVGKWLTEQPSLEGKYVLTYFWTPWSIPCRKMIPELNALQKKFADKLVIVALTSESETDIDAMPGEKIGFASALDVKAKLSGTLDISSVPWALVQDPKGVVRYQGHPSVLTDKTLEKLLVPLEK